MKTIEHDTYRSVHTDYLRFAALSYSECRKKYPSPAAFVTREVVDTIRYSFDCLEATTKFIYFAGKNKHLPIEMPNTWLTRYLDREWKQLSLGNSIGLMSFAWTQHDFWQSSQQFQLFEDLKTLRNGLTHPKPFGKRTFRLPDKSSVEELLEPSFLVHSRLVRGDGKDGSH